MVAAWASRNAEKTQVSSENPPSLLTIDGVAVATMLISIAVRNIASITEAVTIRRPAVDMSGTEAACGAATGKGTWATGRTASAIAGITIGHGSLLGAGALRFSATH